MDSLASAPAWVKSGLEWAGFLCITLGAILVVKHFTLDTKLGDMAGGPSSRRWRRLGFYCLILAAGLVAQRMAQAL
jgi:hypothetical protein